MIAQQRPTPAMSGTSFFSQISSFFGGANEQRGLGTSRRDTSFGSSSSRRGPPQPLDRNAWSLPYSSQNNIPASPAYRSGSAMASPASSHYPPRAPSPYAHDHANAAISTSSVAEFSNMYPAASSSTLASGANAERSSHHNASAVNVSAGSALPSNAYPPLRHTWNRIRRWSRKNYPEISDTLNWPCTEDELDELEMTIGYTLPQCVRESYLNYNGQELESNQSCQDGLFFGAPLLSLDQIAEEWHFWRAVDQDPETGANPQVKNLMASCPHKWIRAEYSCRGWIPLITDHAGNYIGIDLSPHPAGGGSPGQVIIFGRDFDTKVVCWKGEGEGGWGRFLQMFADELEAGEFWTLEEPSIGSEDEEDAIGYESYFSGGGAGAARGGGDRGGEGAAAFRLTGEYKGWPVLEAWADRSVRLWESVGLAPGKPVGNPQLQQQRASSSHPFSVIGGDDGFMPPALRMVDENGQAMDAEGSGSGSAIQAASPAIVGKELTEEVSVDGPAHPLADASLAGDASMQELLEPATEPPQVIEPITSQGVMSTDEDDSGNVTPTNSTRQVSGMLSPPLPETKASMRKQKQREEGWGSPSMGGQGAASPPQPQSRRRPARPPAPVAPLDLPTIEDVKAVQAAVLANDGKSHNIQFDSSQADNSGSGKRGSFSNLGFRDLAGKMGGTGSLGAGAGSRREESLELGERPSAEAAIGAVAPAQSNGINYIVGSRGRARGLGHESSTEDSSTSSTFSSNGPANDPLRAGIRGDRDSSSTTATSPRDSSHEPVSGGAYGHNGATKSAAHEETMKAFNMISISTPPEAGADEMPSLIDASSRPGSPSVKSIGGANGILGPSPLNPASGGVASSKSQTSETEVPVALA